MSNVKTIVQYPAAKVLRKKASEVTSSDEASSIKQIINELVDTCLHYDHCVGLAANQIGHTKRIIVVRPEVENKKITVMVNPKCEPLPDATIESGIEGCMSVQDIQAAVKRPDKIKVIYQDEALVEHELIVADDPFLSRVIQHEIDHIDGIMFLDRLTSVQKQKISKVLKKLNKKD